MRQAPWEWGLLAGRTTLTRIPVPFSTTVLKGGGMAEDSGDVAQDAGSAATGWDFTVGCGSSNANKSL